MRPIVAIIGIIVVALLLFGSCYRNNVDVYDPAIENTKFAAEFDSPTLPPTSEGRVISVPSDSRAQYRLLTTAKLPGGNIEALTRRDGPSGTSFSRREIDCSSMAARYIGSGDTRQDALRDSPNLAELTVPFDGSITGDVLEDVCSLF